MTGAVLASVGLTIGVAVRGPAPVAASAPEPVRPSGGTSTVSVTPPPEPTPSAEPSAAMPTESRSAESSRPAPTSSTAPAEPAGTFQAVAGPACPVDGTRNVHVSTGWQVVPGDSWTGDGCGDRFLYSAPDDANYVQWLFTFDRDGAFTCRVSVFVPDSPLSADLVWYGIGDRFHNVDYRIGGFTVDQEANRGSWVDGATVPVGAGALMVNVDGKQNLTGVTAAPLRVSCGG